VIAENPFTTREELWRHIVNSLFGRPPLVLVPFQNAYISLIVAIANRYLGVKRAIATAKAVAREASGDVSPVPVLHGSVTETHSSLNHPNPSDVIHEVPCPIFLMHGTADKLIPHHHSQTLHDAVSYNKHRHTLIDLC
jgi:hypothetical protein